MKLVASIMQANTPMVLNQGFVPMTVTLLRLYRELPGYHEFIILEKDQLGKTY